MAVEVACHHLEVYFQNSCFAFAVGVVAYPLAAAAFVVVFVVYPASAAFALYVAASPAGAFAVADAVVPVDADICPAVAVAASFPVGDGLAFVAGVVATFVAACYYPAVGYSAFVGDAAAFPAIFADDHFAAAGCYFADCLAPAAFFLSGAAACY